ncbi:hypothetical protein VAEU17_330021 [Vibrio aestuarianus]|nr:hypothetical protein VAEU17_330021 [Vibrio aestuarianus]
MWLLSFYLLTSQNSFYLYYYTQQICLSAATYSKLCITLYLIF